MKAISLTQGVIALVDDEDYDRLNQHKWYAVKSLDGPRWIAYRMSSRKDGQRRTSIGMHREILTAPSDLEVDHVEHYPLSARLIDNRKANLRLCNSMQNNWNFRKRCNTSSSFKGVGWSKEKKRWKARIKVNKQEKNLGYFEDEKEAARAYDRAAREAFGEFARLNFLEKA